MVQRKASGFLFIFLGLILLIYKSSWIPLESFLTGSFFVFVLGITVITFAFIHSIPQFALIGGIISTLGISFWGNRYVSEWPSHNSAIAVMIGVSILLQFAINKNRITLGIGSLILMSGVLTWPGIRELPMIAPVSSFFISYWPLLLIAIGILLLQRK